MCTPQYLKKIFNHFFNVMYKRVEVLDELVKQLSRQSKHLFQALDCDFIKYRESEKEKVRKRNGNL